MLARSLSRRNAAAIPEEVTGLIVGGGVTGCSLLYHLGTHPSMKGGKYLLAEKGELASGATWHAAGLTNYWHGGNNIRFWHQESIDLFKKWESEGTQLSFHKPGSLRLLENKERMEEGHYQYEKTRMYNKLFGGPEMHMIGMDEVAKLHPLVNCDRFMGALYTEGDGHIDPTSVTNKYVEEARKNADAHVSRFTQVTSLKQLPNQKWQAVLTKKNGEEYHVTADFVINAAGLWCDHLGRIAGVTTPSVVLQHQYIITETIPEVKEYHEKHGHQMPVIRDLHGSYYLRDERDGLLVGPYEDEDKVVLSPKEWRQPDSNMPFELENYLFDDDTDRLMWNIEQAAEVVPQMAEAGIAAVVNGPTMWPSDGSHLVGPSFEKSNFWQACAQSYGIVQSGGLGRYLVEWIASGEPPYELTECDPARYGPWATRDWVSEKVQESYGWNNKMAYPNANMPRARPVKPVKNKGIYELLKKKGCQFGFHNGWEAPNWFWDFDENLGNSYGTYHRPKYHGHVHKEAEGLMRHAGLCYWPFAKFSVKGPDAVTRLDNVFANTLPNVGRCALCHMLTPQGKVYSEVTVARISDDEFYLVGSPDMQFHDIRWLRQHLGVWDGSSNLQLTDITDAYGVLMLNGPASGEILAKYSNHPDIFTDLSKFKTYSWQNVILFDDIPVTALRVSYTGEHGWELHLAQDDLPVLYERLMAADEKLVDWGGYAMNSFRMEKGIRAAGGDFTKDHSALEAGLDRWVKVGKKEFIGSKAVEAEKAAGGPTRKSVLLSIDSNADKVDAWGNEPICLDGDVIGFTTSGTYGHMCGLSLAAGYVPIEYAEGGTKLEVPLLGKYYTATVLSEPPIKFAHLRK